MMQTNFLAKFNLPEKFCIVSFFSQNSSYYIIRVKRQMMRLLSLVTTVSGVFFAGAYILFRLNMARKEKKLVAPTGFVAHESHEEGISWLMLAS